MDFFTAVRTVQRQAGCEIDAACAVSFIKAGNNWRFMVICIISPDAVGAGKVIGFYRNTDNRQFMRGVIQQGPGDTVAGQAAGKFGPAANDSNFY